MVTLTDAEWHDLQHDLATLRQHVADLTTALAAAQQRIATLEGRKPPPAGVKANTPPSPAGAAPRKKRVPDQNRARRRDTPTHIVDHRLACCPDCHGRLSRATVARRRQVIELPPPPPVTITEHQVYKHWYSYCRRWQTAPLDLQGQVVGQRRVGVRLMSLVAHLRTQLRLPLRQIQTFLHEQHGVWLSLGELVDLLHGVATHATPAVMGLRDQVRASPVVHADETSWREQGQNGYVWTLVTPDGLRYFAYHHSRAGQVINDLLGDAFTGVLVTDFYGGYNATPGGKHQRCWVHLLRDLQDLHQTHAATFAVGVWVRAVADLYADAHAPQPQVRSLQQAVVALGEQFAQAKGHPCHGIAQRLLRHQDELFTFVTTPGVPAHNNAAERAIRPLIIARTISGGTRSALGSRTRMALTSLWQTWQARGQNAYAQCLRLLQSPVPQL